MNYEIDNDIIAFCKETCKRLTVELNIMFTDILTDAQSVTRPTPIACPVVATLTNECT